LPVPPFAEESIPETPLTRLMRDHAGLLLAPVLERYLVALVSLGSIDVVDAPDPKIKSP
jgi:hypothetical protein